MTENKRNTALQILLWIVQGFLVGVGAILPGVSGGTLCYAFGIYDPMIEVLSTPIKGIKKHWFMLIFLGVGGLLGFVGFAGITEALLRWNEAVVLCVFVGLIAGTLPELWKESGEHGRNKFSFLALGISFVAIGALFLCFEHLWTLRIPANFGGFAICGVVWALSFIIPGFSSSTLLLFFGIYSAMADGISNLDLKVLVPLGAAMLITMLLLSKVMRVVFEKYHNIASHCVLGFVLATTLLILPSFCVRWQSIVIYVLCIIGGAIASFFLTRLFAAIKNATEDARPRDKQNEAEKEVE